MNAKRKEAAIKLYKATEGTADDKIAALTLSEKAYTPDEVAEVLAAISEAPATKTDTAKTDSVVENVIKAASSVVDTDVKPSGKTDVSPSGGTGADTEWLRNKTTGNEVKMNGNYARKIARRKPNEYEIIVKK